MTMPDEIFAERNADHQPGHDDESLATTTRYVRRDIVDALKADLLKALNMIGRQDDHINYDWKKSALDRIQADYKGAGQ